MNSTPILILLAAKPGSYIFDDVGTNEIVLKEADNSEMKLVDSEDQSISTRFPYPLVEGLIQQRYIRQDQQNARIYRTTRDGLLAARS